MNTLIILAICLAAAVAAPIDTVEVRHDTLGNYNLRFQVPGISRVEDRDAFGNVNGGFSYYDDLGILRQTHFTSGVHGVHAVGTDIPVPVQDTPEVARAKAEHLAVLNAAYLSSPPSPHFFDF
ncbi:cuticle protein 7-like [Photinus pyralis]|uniref:cuticle protein 7-like n=1 Tax=Photinus pyralis TaxID=7054 RepID=UPI00126732FA|nr:cuticle protein 7-like [Photinus pyralis]